MGVEIDGPPVPVVATAPALLTDSHGCISGFNSDGTLNSSTNLATPGSFIAIFGEGAGLMNPAVTGGIGNGQSKILAANTANLNEFGITGSGSPLTILYAGDVPGFVEGLFEMNLQLPTSLVQTSQTEFSVNIMIGNSPAVSVCVWVKHAN
jgi:uncharacterized protein (TIGR03437 family)